MYSVPSFNCKCVLLLHNVCINCLCLYYKGIHGKPCDMFLSLQDGWTPLMGASGAGHVEFVKVLLDRGALVNLQDNVSAVANQATLYVSCWDYKGELF